MELSLESRPRGDLRACELDQQICVGCGKLHFASAEKEMKILQRFLGGVKIITLVLLRLTAICLRSQNLVRAFNYHCNPSGEEDRGSTFSKNKSTTIKTWCRMQSSTA